MVRKNLVKKIFLAGLVLIFGFLLFSDFALAAEEKLNVYKSLIPIPGMVSKIPNNPNVLEYLGGLYKFLISAVGIVAMTAIVIGGARYLTSVGNPSAIENAKHTIWSAIWGLLLAITSWVIVSTINPDILLLHKPGMPWEGGRYESAPVDPLEACDGVGSQNIIAGLPCNCIDGKQIMVGNTATNISLSINPIAPLSGAPYSITILLKDSGGAAVSSKGLMLNNRKIDGSSSNDSIGNTDSSGQHIYSISTPGCISNNIFEVVFVGDNIYAPSSATLVYEIAGPVGTPGCIYNDKPGASVVSGGTTCAALCASPTNYHCAVADLRVGISADRTQNNKKDITIDVGETVFFDARTYSRDFTYPSLKIDVPSTDDSFKNGIDGYLIETGRIASAVDPKWNNKAESAALYAGEVLDGGQYDYAEYETAGNCSGFLTGLTQIIQSALGGVPSKGTTYYKFNTVGDYKAVLNVYSYVDGVCKGPFIDRVYIHVKLPL